uniref:Uncharacterized protein n=1 Tax=Arundo donax TaxID=35708 RepID=A0A0A9ELC5_ARUDO
MCNPDITSLCEKRKIYAISRLKETESEYEISST